MRDFLQLETNHRDLILRKIQETSLERGFQRIQTPALEKIERLKSGDGGENESMIFEVLRRGLDPADSISPSRAVDMGLRYDLTLPLSRFYATHRNSIPGTFKAFQAGNVWRAERPQKGRYREFMQCDLDIIGDDTILAEIELLGIGFEVLDRLGLAESSTIIINDRRLLVDVLTRSGVDKNKQASALITLDKADKLGMSAVIDELVTRVGIPEMSARAVESEVKRLASLREIGTSEREDNEADLYDIPAVIKNLKNLYPKINIQFEPTLVRGMGYYTGLIYEVVNPSSSSSICGGGRYDGMIGRWAGDDAPAVGLSFGFERIADLLGTMDAADSIALAIGYSSESEFMSAMELREDLFQKFHYKIIGVEKIPKKVKASFYESLKNRGFDQYMDVQVGAIKDL